MNVDIGDSVSILWMLAVPMSGTQTNIKVTMDLKRKKKWTNHKVINFYFKSNPIRKAYRKRMMEIWTESAKQRLANQVRLILKKGLLSDLEILEICGQKNREEHNQKL